MATAMTPTKVAKEIVAKTKLRGLAVTKPPKSGGHVRILGKDKRCIAYVRVAKAAIGEEGVPAKNGEDAEFIRTWRKRAGHERFASVADAAKMVKDEVAAQAKEAEAK